MTCDEVRVALSAWLDGEDPGVPVAWLAAHQTACAGCREWLARAEQVGHTLRRDPAAAPDLAAGAAGPPLPMIMAVGRG